MCAIAGILNTDGSAADRTTLDRMLAVQSHRGPDDEGRHFDGPIGLGHRRLSILDLSRDGHQPMANEDAALWLLYNGEVYNYVELRALLEARGHRFRSATDSEVLLHGFEEWGEDLLPRLNGMFAFALWDARRRRLFCARDRLGVKPFYYHRSGRRFAFASEIKALFADPAVPRSPDVSALRRFLAAEMQDEGEGTSFADIRQLPAGHALVVDAAGGEPRPRRWWSLPTAALHPAPTLAQSADRVRELLEDSVRLRLRSDVPVGTCLSGGLDSSTIVCLAAKQLRASSPGARLATFSSRSHDPRIDEGRFIAPVARATNAEEHSVYPTADEFLEHVERVMWHQEEPFHSPSVFAQDQVMRLAHERGVKVLLDGQGGDEVFAGYLYFVPPNLADLALRARWLRLGAEWKAQTKLRGTSARSLFLRTLRSGLPASVANAVWERRASEPWLGPALASGERTSMPAPAAGRDRLHSALQFAALCSPLPNYLHHEDRNSMAWSIEARVPFLDYRVVEYAAGLPSSHLLAGGWTKVVLREAMRGILPESVRLRFDKQGFSTPHGQWFRGEARQLLRDLLAGERTRRRGWIDPEFAARVAADVEQGRPVDDLLAWRCAAVELWARVLVDRPSADLLTRPARPGTPGSSTESI